MRDYERWLSEIVKAWRDVIGDVKIYLSGSVAERKAVISSDIDVIVVSKNKSVERAMKRAELIAEIEERDGLPFVHPFEFHLMSEDEFKTWKEIFKPKLRRIF